MFFLFNLNFYLKLWDFYMKTEVKKVLSTPPLKTSFFCFYLLLLFVVAVCLFWPAIVGFLILIVAVSDWGLWQIFNFRKSPSYTCISLSRGVDGGGWGVWGGGLSPHTKGVCLCVFDSNLCCCSLIIFLNSLLSAALPGPSPCFLSLHASYYRL